VPSSAVNDYKPQRPAFICSFLVVFALLLSTFSLSHASSQEETEEKLKKLKTDIQTISTWLSSANKEETGLIKSLKKYEIQISQTSKAITQTKKKITQVRRELKELNQDLKIQKKTLKSQQNYLKEELKALYLEGKQPKIKALLDQDNPQQSGRFLAYFSYLKEARSETLDQYKASVEKLEKTQNTILRRQADLNSAQEELREKRKKLETQTLNRKNTLTKLRSQIKNKSAELSQLKTDQTQLEKLLREVEKAVSELALPDASTPFSSQKRKLPWPARGRVIERFGAQLVKGKLRSNGIRIATKDNTEVKSVHYGRVVFSDWLRGFGLLIIVDHGDSFMSLYGNNKTLLRETGDWVLPGEILAYSGNSGGKNQSSLYFEIRKNGKPQNPIKWLKK